MPCFVHFFFFFLTSWAIRLMPCFICSQVLGIDAEFVSLAPAVKEPNPEVPGGPDIVVQAARLGLARVSVVRGGQTSGLGDSNDTASLVPVIDDYIRAVEPVHDYLTRFSGLVPGDLDPALSKHHIVELKHAYLKLRYLCLLYTSPSPRD